jgi:lysophospholipase L1-like esterase
MNDKMKVREGKDGYSYPYTSPDLVIDQNGKSTTTKFNELENKIEKVGSTSIDDTNTATDKTWSSSKIDTQFKDIEQQKATINEVNAINKRVDNLIVHSAEGTTKDSELVDLRVNSKGKTYTIAGDFLRDIDKKIDGISNDENASFIICDEQGYIIFKADSSGIKGINMGGSSTNNNPYNNMKMISLGDSLSAHDKWQKYLVDWLGVKFDLDENLNGKDGHKPTAIGGTSIDTRLSGENSIYMRALDVKYYNPDLIIVYAGQNDWCGENGVLDTNRLGTINDTPYKDRVITSDVKTFYSNYMGMIECLLEDNPTSKIILVTQMKNWTSDGLQDNIRQAKAQAVINIAKKYSLPVIDLWNGSGVNSINAKSYYPNVGNVHPNDYGYKQIAMSIYRNL